MPGMFVDFGAITSPLSAGRLDSSKPVVFPATTFALHYLHHASSRSAIELRPANHATSVDLGLGSPDFLEISMLRRFSKHLHVITCYQRTSIVITLWHHISAILTLLFFVLDSLTSMNISQDLRTRSSRRHTRPSASRPYILNPIHLDRHLDHPGRKKTTGSHYYQLDWAGRQRVSFIRCLVIRLPPFDLQPRRTTFLCRPQDEAVHYRRYALHSCKSVSS